MRIEIAGPRELNPALRRLAHETIEDRGALARRERGVNRSGRRRLKARRAARRRAKGARDADRFPLLPPRLEVRP